MQEQSSTNSKIIAFLGGAALVGFLAILAVLLQIVQIGQTEIHANTNDRVNATIVAIQEMQLDNLEQLTTLQALSSSDEPSLTTSVAKQAIELESTIEALEDSKLAVEATATANAVSFRPTTSTEQKLSPADYGRLL